MQQIARLEAEFKAKEAVKKTEKPSRAVDIGIDDGDETEDEHIARRSRSRRRRDNTPGDAQAPDRDSLECVFLKLCFGGDRI